MLQNAAVKENWKQHKQGGAVVGQRLADYLKDSGNPCLTAGKVFTFNQVILGQNILEYRREYKDKKLQAEMDKIKSKV